MQKNTRTTALYALLVFIAGSSYGFLVPVIKIAKGQGLDPFSFLPSMYIIAFAVGLVVTLVQRVPLATPRQLAKLAFLGVLTSSTSLCYYNAVALLPGAVALTLLFQYVWVGVVIECVVERRLPARSTVIAVIIVLVGTLFAAGVFEATFFTLDPLGLACGAGSAVFYALFLFASGRLGADEPVALRTTMVGVGGFVTTLVFNPLYFTTSFLMPQTWPFAVILAFVGVLVPVGLIALAGPHLTTGMVNVMASSELPVGIIAAWVAVAEQPSALALLGAALVLVGIVYKQLADARSAQ